MTNPTPLSPTAQAVLSAAEDAYGYNYSEFYCCADRVAAAVLRAAADQIDMKQPLGGTDADAGVFAAHSAISKWLLAIAAEMEGKA